MGNPARARAGSSNAVRYLHFLAQTIEGYLRYSHRQNARVVELAAEHISATVELAVPGLICEIPVGLPLKPGERLFELHGPQRVEHFERPDQLSEPAPRDVSHSRRDDGPALSEARSYQYSFVAEFGIVEAQYIGQCRTGANAGGGHKESCAIRRAGDQCRPDR